MPRSTISRSVWFGAALSLSVAVLPAAYSTAQGQAFTSYIFLATHNSYSGDVDGSKNSINYQLDHGVRFIELDIHDNDYSSNHDYSIGHSGPGNLVDHSGGNPSSNLLHDWLNLIATWSNAHPTHAPLVVMVDIKDDLTDNTSYAAGNLAALSEEFETAFGDHLLFAADYPTSQPSVDSLRGKVLALLSGDAGTRQAYRRDVGHNPAVAINAHGQVVEVHDSGAGALWYWTGVYGSDGRVTWLRHGKYDSGVTPAIVLDNSGNIVEVHKSQNFDTLWYHVGHLGSDGEISWSPSHQYDNGILPSLAFTGTGTLREVHQSQNNSQNWTWNGVLNTSNSTVTWSGNAETSDARYDKTSATSSVGNIHVYTAVDGATPAQTLRYTTAHITGGRIQYQQIAFDEYQAGDSAELQDALFYAATATNSTFIINARQTGHLVRGWDFDSASYATSPLANYPASNTPWASWYQNIVTQAGAVQ